MQSTVESYQGFFDPKTSLQEKDATATPYQGVGIDIDQVVTILIFLMGNHKMDFLLRKRVQQASCARCCVTRGKQSWKKKTPLCVQCWMIFRFSFFFHVSYNAWHKTATRLYCARGNLLWGNDLAKGRELSCRNKISQSSSKQSLCSIV